MDGTDPITNDTDIIDSRDVIARIAYLEASDCQEPDGEGCASVDACPSCYGDAEEELKALKDLQDEAEGYAGDWRYGAALIRDTYFTEYAEQLAEDIGAIDRNATWPLSHIDWEAAADELKTDYTSVSFGGTDYWIR